MKRIRIMGLCLVAVFAMSAVAASVATAEPEFLTKAVVGESAPSKIAIKGTLGAAFLEGSVSKSKITCTGGSALGEVINKTESVNNITTFTTCESSGAKCESGATEGVIVTKALHAKLNGITSSLPGERLFSESEGRGGILAEFECGGIVKVVVKGSVIGSLSGASGSNAETGKLGSSLTLAFTETNGLQKYTSFAEGSEKGEKEQLSSVINGGTPELSGQSVSVKLVTIPSTLEMGVTK